MIKVSWLQRLVRVLFFSASAIVIAMAVTLVVARHLLPNLVGQKSALELWAGQYIHKPVAIGNIDANWSGFGPEITLSDVEIFTDDKQERLLSVNQLHLGINLFQSIWQRKVVPNVIIIEGAGLSVQHLPDGRWSIVGATGEQQGGDRTQLLDWLLSQHRIGLKHVEANIIDNAHDPVTLNLDEFLLTNDGNRHRASGTATLTQHTSSRITLAADFMLEHHDFNKLSADLFVSLANINLADWVNDDLLGYQVTSGNANMRTWLHWRQGKLVTVRGGLGASSVFLMPARSQAVKQRIDALQMNYYLTLTGKSWGLTADQVNIVVNGVRQPISELAIKHMVNAKNKTTQIELGYFDIGSALPLLINSNLLSEKQCSQVTALRPSGRLNNLVISQHEKNNAQPEWSVGADFFAVSLARWQQFSGLRNLSGRFNLTPTSGAAQLDSHNVRVNLGDNFANDVVINQLGAVAMWQKHGDAWSVRLPSMLLANNDIDIHGNASVWLPPEGASPRVNALLKYELHPVSQAIINRYLPKKIGHPRLLKWLQTSFEKIGGATGTAVLRGSLADFPYDKHQGRFIVKTHISDLDLEYHSEWPEAKGVTGDLVYDTRTLTMMANKATIYNTQLDKLTARIPYIAKDWDENLEITGSMRGDLATGLQFIHDSPLEEKIGNDVKNLGAHGPMKLNLAMIMPLGHHKIESKINGEVGLQGATLSVPAWNFNLTDMQGSFGFTESGINARGLSGSWFGYPMNMRIATLRDSKNRRLTQISIGGQAGIEALRKQFNFPILGYMQGKTEFRGILQLRGDDNPDSLLLESDLNGVVVDLPKPFNKPKTDYESLSLHTYFGGNHQLQLTLNYSDWMSANLLYKRDDDATEFDRGTININAGEAKLLDEPGLTVIGNLKEWRWDDWKAFTGVHPVGRPEGKGTVKESTLQDTLNRIEVQVDKAYCLGREFDDARVSLRYGNKKWQMAVKSKQVSGNLLLPEDMQNGTIAANLEELHYDSPKDKTGSPIKPQDLPSIHMKVDKFYYNKNPYGNLELVLEPCSDGVSIDRFYLHSPVADMDAKGTWLLKDNVENTALHGQAASADMQTLFKYLKLDFGMELHSGDTDFDVTWPGSPGDFALAKLNGNAKLHLGEGRIVDIGKEADAKISFGRFLNLLSIQNLPRRLILNFGDLTEKGFGFSAVNGNFILDTGNAMTDDTVIDGSVAKITMAGRIGLVAQDFNLKLGVAPHVTSSLPVVATLTAGPVAGALSFLVDRVVSSEMSKPGVYNYQLTGTWKNPKMEPIANQQSHQGGPVEGSRT